MIIPSNFITYSIQNLSLVCYVKEKGNVIGGHKFKLYDCYNFKSKEKSFSLTFTHSKKLSLRIDKANYTFTIHCRFSNFPEHIQKFGYLHIINSLYIHKNIATVYNYDNKNSMDINLYKLVLPVSSVPCHSQSPSIDPFFFDFNSKYLRFN